MNELAGWQAEEDYDAPDAYFADGVSGEDDDITLISVWHTALRRYILLTAILLVALIAGLVLALQPRKYVASGSLRIRPGQAETYKVQVNQLAGSSGSDERLESAVAILQNKQLYTKVAEDLHLAANPAVAGKYATSNASLNDPYVQDRVITAMRKMIQVERTPKTQIITITCESTSPPLASEIVDTLMNEYVESIFTTRFSSTQRATKFLTSQLEDLKNQVLSDQRQLVDLQSKLGGIGLDDTHNLVTAQLEDLARANQQANLQRITAEARYRILQDERLDLVEGVPAMLSSDSEASGGTLLQTLRRTRAQIATQYASVAEQFGPNYPETKRLKAQLAEATAQVNSGQQRVLEEAKVAFEAAQRNQRMTNDALNRQRSQASLTRNDMVSYEILLHDYQSSRNLYEALMQRLREAGVTSGLESNEVQFVDLATLPVAPSGYGLFELLAICLCIGLAFALTAAVVLQSLDTSVHSADELERYLHVPLLAVVPTFVPGKPALTIGSSASATATQKPIVQSTMEVMRAPQSYFAEGIRLLRTSLLLSGPDERLKRMLFTSSASGEGKSTVSSNEACMLAMNGARVLLIDADLRRPTQHTRFRVANRAGLSTLLTGEAKLQDLVSSFEDMPTLHLLTSGPLPPSPGDLLGSKAMHRLLAVASEQYDFVLIDTPPSLAITDSALLAELVDAVVVVVRSGVANKKMVRRTVHTLARTHSNIAGFVFNGVDKRSADYYGYQQYEAAHSRVEMEHAN